LTAAADAGDRTQAIDDWNKNPKVRVLIGSSKAAAESVNLQEGGHIKIIVDVLSVNQIFPLIGRMNRIRQEHEQICYLLTPVNTYDGVLQYRHMARFKELLRATAGLSYEVISDIANRQLPAAPQARFDRETHQRGPSRWPH
jgi:hypothetical protein